MKTGLLQYNATNKGSRPEIQDDPGERGKRKETRRSSTPPTRDSAPCRRRASVEINFRRETATSENETIERSRGRTIVQATIKRSILTEIVRILGKRTEVNRRPRCYPESEKLKVLPDFPNLRSESRQYAASKAL